MEIKWKTSIQLVVYLSALITLNSNLEKILIFTKHSLYVLCEEDVQICVKVLLRKHRTNLKSSKSWEGEYSNKWVCEMLNN
jgi:hypothetical protein